jgi:hypothetical protein
VTGAFISTWQSPYFGVYPMDGNVWCHPNGTNLLVRGGVVFSSSSVQAQDMLYVATLAGGLVDGADFDVAHQALFTVGEEFFYSSTNFLRWYNSSSYQLISSQVVSNGSRYLHASGPYIYVAAVSATNTIFQRLANPAVPAPVIAQQPQGVTAATGSDIMLGVTASGTPPLRYQWFFQGTAIVGAYDATLSLTNVQRSQSGLYWVVVSNAFGSVTSSNALVIVNDRPVADASATPSPVVSANGSNATAILDGSRSFDDDGDALQFIWLEAGNLLETGRVAIAVLTLGTHTIQLVVSDGLFSATNAITIEVLTGSQALDRLQTIVKSEVPRPVPLNASLDAAIASINRGDLTSALNQIHAFQNKVRAQVAPHYPALAEQLLQNAQEIIDALSSQGQGLPHPAFTTLAHRPESIRMRFTAQPQHRYIIEASNDLRDWQKIGVAVGRADGTAEFEDTDGSRLPFRFYRLFLPK